LGINIANGIQIKLPKSEGLVTNTIYDQNRNILSESQEQEPNPGAFLVKTNDLSIGLQYQFK